MKVDILKNVLFNVGYMWIDLVMIATGRPGKTYRDYFYYISYYITDFLARFLFRDFNNENCWYEWAKCA